ncbi:MAG: efflux RND transporter periplasmic adaptor subunit [Gammaproteobacteria bacterium]
MKAMIGRVVRSRAGFVGGWLVLFGLTDVASTELPFDVATAERRRVVAEQIFDAQVEAVHRSTVSAETSGRVIEIHHDVDDYVAKGAVLLRLTDTQQRANLRQATATLEEAQARHREAKARFDRVQELFAKKLVSKQEADQAGADLKATAARLQLAQGGVEKAREGLEQTVVRAPYSGVVVKRHVELGETASPGQALMTGLSLEQLRAVAAVPQSLIEAVRTYAQASVIDASSRHGRIPAEKLTFTPYADPYSHTFRVRMSLPTGDYGLYPGTFVKVAFVTGEQERLLIPAQAVAYRSEVRGVYVVDEDGRVGLRHVRLGRAYADDMEVLAGLSAGEQVALDPVRAAVYLKETSGRRGT